MTTTWDQSTPIYQQLRDRTVASILDGHLQEGDLLPSVRQVAIDLQVNPITVSKAYQMLVDEALVVPERGIGMRIKMGAKDQLLQDERSQFLQHDWPQILDRIQQLNLSWDELPLSQPNKKAGNS